MLKFIRQQLASFIGTFQLKGKLRLIGSATTHYGDIYNKSDGYGLYIDCDAGGRLIVNDDLTLTPYTGSKTYTKGTIRLQGHNSANYSEIVPSDAQYGLSLTCPSAGAAAITLIDSITLTVAANQNLQLGGVSTAKVGFYGVTPISRATLATGAGATVDNVITALQNLGLVKQS